jgi:hypothetical protein
MIAVLCRAMLSYAVPCCAGVCVNPTVEALVAVASRPVGVTHIWALHGLWLVAGSAGVGYAAHVKRSLQLALELLVSMSIIHLASLRRLVHASK